MYKPVHTSVKAFVIWEYITCFVAKDSKQRTIRTVLYLIPPKKNYINVINGVVTCLLSADGKHLAELVVERGHLARLDLGRQSPGNQGQYTNTVCLRSSDPFYIVSYYIKWVTSSWTYSRLLAGNQSFRPGFLLPGTSFSGGSNLNPVIGLSKINIPILESWLFSQERYKRKKKTLVPDISAKQSQILTKHGRNLYLLFCPWIRKLDISGGKITGLYIVYFGYSPPPHLRYIFHIA